jgi:aryl-alcohol dehydrogenase-like predicted oxidoreductase
MQYRQLGKTNLKVSEIGFGAFGISGNLYGESYGPTTDEDSVAALREAINGGCNFIDTADCYGLGHSERLIGDVLSNANCASGVIVATKGGTSLSHPGTQDFSPEHLEAAVEASLRRLRRETVDLYFLHNPPLDTIRRGEAFDVLERLIAKGKIRWGGVSVHNVEEARAAMAFPSCAAIHIVVNLLSHLSPHQAADGILEQVQASGLGLVARETLSNGFLSASHRMDLPYSNGDIRAHMTLEARRFRIALATKLQAGRDEAPTSSQLALRYVLDEPVVSTALVGMKTVKQVRENLAASDLAPLYHHFARGAVTGAVLAEVLE